VLHETALDTAGFTISEYLVIWPKMSSFQAFLHGQRIWWFVWKQYRHFNHLYNFIEFGDFSENNVVISIIFTISENLVIWPRTMSSFHALHVQSIFMICIKTVSSFQSFLQFQRIWWFFWKQCRLFKHFLHWSLTFR
jgi:hypothetical protein